METEYVYHDAVLLKAALAGSVFSLDVWLYRCITRTEKKCGLNLRVAAMFPCSSTGCGNMPPFVPRTAMMNAV